MDFKDNLKSFSDRVIRLRDGLLTEEATKNALIMPFIQLLGYDVFNPDEVVPEYTCDIGTKKGEKIDYAILKDGKPVMLIECKHCKQDLNLHDNQLLRYFGVSDARLAILTNGVIYRFYTDTEKPNKMDEKHFLEVDLTDIKTEQIDDIKKFHKNYFDVNSIISSASELKYATLLKGIFSREFESPSPEFVTFLGRQIYDGRITTNVLEQFTPIVKKAIISYINGLISNRLNAALKTEENVEMAETAEVVETKKVAVTTETEMNAYYIIKAILRGHIDMDRIVYKDALDYFAINVDNIYKNVCRLYFNNPDNLRIAFRSDDNKEIRTGIISIDDLYNYADKIIQACEKYK
jgi:hypothetical protein